MSTYPWDKINEGKKWLKFHGDIFVRKFIFPKNLIHYCDNEEEEEEEKEQQEEDKDVNWIFKILHKEQNFSVEKNDIVPKKNVFTKLFDDDDDDSEIMDYYINNIFEKNFTTLTQNLKILKKYHRCNFYLLFGEIFNICRIVALDLKKEYLISIYNNKLYIIMYTKFLYMRLKMENNDVNNDDDDDDDDDDPAATTTSDNDYDDYDKDVVGTSESFKTLNIYSFVKRFINYNNKSEVLNRAIAIEEEKQEENEEEENDDDDDDDEEEKEEVEEKKEEKTEESTPLSLSSLRLPSFTIFNGLFGGFFSIFTPSPPLLPSPPPPSPPLSQQQQQQLQPHKDVIITNWDKWGPMPKDFLIWEYIDFNHNDDIYVRKNIHYKKPIRDIFVYSNIGNDALITNKNPSIQKLKKCIFYYNHLLLSKNSWLLNYHNVIYIDFSRAIFTTLNVKKNEKNKKLMTKFQTFLMSSTDDDEPWMDYEIFVDDDYINYMDYISLISTTCNC